MSILKKIFSTGAKELTDSVGGIVDGLSTTDEEKLNAKAKISSIVTDSLAKIASYQRDVLVQELKGNWLQRSWRPLLMLTFGGIIICKWFGVTDASIPDNLELELLGIIKLGLGGYVVGRSVEKVAGTVTQNIDLPFLKKKDRNLE